MRCCRQNITRAKSAGKLRWKSPRDILIGVAATALFAGGLFATILRNKRRLKEIALLAAGVNAVIWAIGYGVWSWYDSMDLMDLEHIKHFKNYPLWLHILLMAFSAIVYALVSLPAAVLVGAVFRRFRRADS